jgi:hypothetical protein
MVNGDIQVFAVGFAEDFLSAEVHLRFNLVLDFFHGHDDADIDHMVEMSCYFFHLVRDMIADRRSDLKVVAREVQVHGFSFFKAFF